MKIHELLAEDTTPFRSVKDLAMEFRDLAASRDLVIVAGMGWPQLVKGGAWYGGGLTTKQLSASYKNKDDISVPEETRVMSFLKELAKRLEKFMAEGRVVKIAKGARRATSQEEAVPGKVYEQLKSAMINVEPPGNVRGTRKYVMRTLAWYVSLPQELADKTTVSFISGFMSGDDPEKRVSSTMVFPADITLANDLIKKSKQLNKRLGDRTYDQTGGKLTAVYAEASDAVIEAYDALGQFAQKITGKRIARVKDGYDLGHVWVSFDKGSHGKDVIMLSAAQVAELVSIINDSAT